MTAPSSRKLVETLRAAGLLTLAMRAEKDEFHDFLSDSAMPSMDLDRALSAIIEDAGREPVQRMAAHHIRMRHHEGEFDATKEESDEWAASPEGQGALSDLIHDLAGNNHMPEDRVKDVLASLLGINPDTKEPKS